jgi:hypothetical protein
MEPMELREAVLRYGTKENEQGEQTGREEGRGRRSFM